jgi:Mn-dependent DtxR family transcriptional regulator
MLKNLKKEKLITITRSGNHRLTDEGKKALRGEK